MRLGRAGSSRAGKFTRREVHCPGWPVRYLLAGVSGHTHQEKAARRGLRCLVIGGHAVNAFCEPRAALDMDLLVRKGHKAAWGEILQAEEFQVRHDGETFLPFSPPCGVSWV